MQRQATPSWTLSGLATVLCCANLLEACAWHRYQDSSAQRLVWQVLQEHSCNVVSRADLLLTKELAHRRKTFLLSQRRNGNAANTGLRQSYLRRTFICLNRQRCSSWYRLSARPVIGTKSQSKHNDLQHSHHSAL
jgi:hypothetical protein